MAKAYYGSRFSPNMTETPEGFLICHNVPIARTGWQDYLASEFGLDEPPDKIVRVYRSEEEVFHPAAIASFEGKVLTDDHPPEDVTPENATFYTKGVVQNVRRGSGTENDLLIADLVAYEQQLIEEIRSGKREVSCGYECLYVERDDGTYEQKKIRGNHVAVVEDGRAGVRVAIKDSKNDPPPKGVIKMAKITLPIKKATRSVRDALAAVGLKVFATDAEPEEIMDAVEALAEEKSAETNDEESANTPPNQEAKETGDEASTSPEIAAMQAQLNKMEELITKMAQGGGGTQDATPEAALDDAIAQLESQTDDTDEEESHTIPTESMDEAGPVTDPEDRPQSAMDRAVLLDHYKAMKPVVAAMKDPVEKKRVVDAMLAGLKHGKSGANTYAKIERGKQAAANKQKTADSKTNDQAVDQSQLGQDWAKKYNPHYQNRA